MANSGNVRGVIELFCKILADNTVHGEELNLRAETLRQAKFNNSSAILPMWQLLHNVVCYCNRKFSSSKRDASQLTEDEVVLIKCHLQGWGYLDQKFASLNLQSQNCSRQLLLAVGWTIHRKKLFDFIVTRRCNPLHETLGSFIKGEAPALSSFQLRKELKSGKNLSVKGQLQVQVLLCGKLHQAMKRLYATHQLHTTLTYKIASSTKGVSLQPDLDHLTPVEVLLIKNKQELKKMMVRIEEDSEQMKSLLEWKEKENIFWEWMESVLSLHIEETKEDIGNEDGEDQVFLSVPVNIGQDIMETRGKLRDLILSHENHIENMEKLAVLKRIPKSDIQWMAHILEREIAQLSYSLAHCGLGLDEQSDRTSQDEREVEHKPFEDGEKADAMFSRQQGKKAVRNAQAEITKKMKEKMDALQKTVNDLELELKNLQAQHLQKLQVHVTQDPSFICIQPTAVKHLFKS